MFCDNNTPYNLIKYNENNNEKNEKKNGIQLYVDDGDEGME